MYRTYYERRVNQLVDRQIQELIDKYELKQKKDNYMCPAESKVFSTTHNIVNDLESDSIHCPEENDSHEDDINVNLTQESITTNVETSDRCDWEDIDQQFDNNASKRRKYCDPKFRIDYPAIKQSCRKFNEDNPDWEYRALPGNDVKNRNKRGSTVLFWKDLSLQYRVYARI